ncbi:MAG: dihydroneopterin aldolase [Bdellovibrionia bacterium]
MDPKKTSLLSSVAISGLRLPVHLGCSADERATPQWVSVHAEVRFQKLPQGCFSDDLEQTLCYAQMADQIRRVCLGQEFHLIEKLGWEVYSAIQTLLPSSAALRVQIVKEKPPIADLHNGSIFTLGDWI